MSSYSSSFFLGNTGPPSTPEFGKPIRNLFLLEEGTVFTNHGSYGAVPREVMEKRVQLLNTAEAHPDRWFRTTVRPLYDSAIADVANFVGADPKNLVFVQNATAAVNTVLKNLVLGPEDIILSNSHSYNACNNAIESAIKRCNADTLSLDLRFPIRSEEEVVEQVVEICKRNTGIRLAMVDHISSPSAIVFPIATLATELHKLGVLLLVDGAHAPGQLHLDLETLGADFYTGNLHKWCFAPRGSAFLWVAPQHRESIQPLVTSHLYNHDLTDQFFMQGSMDQTSYLSCSAALEFYKRLGGRAALVDYAKPLLDWAQQMLCHALGTPVLPIPPNMQAPFMRVLRLPKLAELAPIPDSCPIIAQQFMDQGVDAQFAAFSGHLWLRISFNVYNCREDYVMLKEELLRFFSP